MITSKPSLINDQYYLCGNYYSFKHVKYEEIVFIWIRQFN